MSRGRAVAAGARRLPRRAALLLPVTLGGCGLLDNWFGENKTPLPGTRIAIPPRAMGSRWTPRAPASCCRRRCATPIGRRPAATRRTRWAICRWATRWQTAWRADIGDGGGYRRKITAQPVVAGGRVFTMDSDAVVTAYSVANGARDMAAGHPGQGRPQLQRRRRHRGGRRHALRRHRARRGAGAGGRQRQDPLAQAGGQPGALGAHHRRRAAVRDHPRRPVAGPRHR